MDFRGFSRIIRLRGSRIQENTDRLVRKVALAADQAAVSGTPVDTGRAKSNWLVQVGSANTSEVEAYVPGIGRSTASQNEDAALAQGRAEIAKYKNGQEIHITNNLPYIGELNDGSSAQAPKNFVETAVIEAANAVKNSRIVDGD